ncbi:MarR family transcriptional regulator [Paeniglutamicibacter sp. NPDC091659]|uniref:MarR family transcriptional regulator n=1 Tax=Paeniglutamicibacter sp. NPDC091659 TaxID=3364389 RepID=UPI003823E4A8
MHTSLHISVLEPIVELSTPPRVAVQDAKFPLDRSADLARASAEWKALAAAIAGQPMMRLSKDGGRNYFTKNTRALTAELPHFPAAVMVTGKDGRVASFCLDFDSGRGDVAADVLGMKILLTRCGLGWIQDTSPSGGFHIYVPWRERIDFTSARETVEALAKRFPSLDPSPHQSVYSGCIRVPGSPWKHGGHQTLTQPLKVAVEVATLRNPSSGHAALRAELTSEMASLRETAEAPIPLSDPQEESTAVRTTLRAEAEQMGRHGTFDTSRYCSPSEARQAVLASAAGSGWSLTDVQRRMHDGTWAGLAGFYARYSPNQRGKALRADWRKAETFCATKATRNEAGKTGRKYDTSRINTQGGLRNTSLSNHQFLRSWERVLHSYERSHLRSREGVSLRFLLRALLEAAHKKNSPILEFGVRAYALATGTHESTVARQLRMLASGPTPLIRQASEGRGRHADAYELVIPDDYTVVAETMPWKKGKTHALRPVFRELGQVAALVYEAIEKSQGGATTAGITRETGLSPTSTKQALEMLNSWNLVSRTADGWIITNPGKLRTLAEYFGVLEAMAAQHATHRIQRAAWHSWLDSRANAFGTLALMTDDYEYADEDIPFWPEHYELDTSLMAIALNRAS